MAVVATPIVDVARRIEQDSIMQPKWDGRKWSELQKYRLNGQWNGKYFVEELNGRTIKHSAASLNRVTQDGMVFHCYKSLQQIINIRAPNGQLVPVTKCNNWKIEQGWEREDHVLYTDNADEVAGEDNPANTDPRNTTAYRVATVYAKCIISDPVDGDIEEIRPLGTFDYEQFGFKKIGKIWVDEARPSDVRKAQQRTENEKKLNICILL